VDDFVAAHRRHWRDAELLFEHERIENADQLYGFSAECRHRDAARVIWNIVRAEGLPKR